MTNTVYYTRLQRLERLMTIDEVTAILGVSRATVYDWICDDKINAVEAGHKSMFKPSEILRFIEKQANEPIKVC